MYKTPNTQILHSQVSYIETSIRPGLTIDQSRWERLKSLAGGAQPATA
jgi:hypothetical protein